MTTDSLVVLLTVLLQSPKIHYGKLFFKTCELDAIPTTLRFECLDAILPTLTDVVNHSLSNGAFALIFNFY